jgi:4-diphosphocytidyl-2-C-methyl-D-erythritol kinase
MLTATACAKLNLTLEILDRRDDGYHEIRSVVQAIDLVDLLHFEVSGGTEVSCTMPGWNAEESLVMRAIDLLSDATGADDGITIDIEKRIPLMSGLAGDSSNAAAVLVALDRLWRLELPPEKLHELAAKLGSDVPFFLTGGTARVSGRGEILQPLASPKETWLVVVVPAVARQAGKTARAYGRLVAGDFTDGARTQRLAAALPSLDGELLYNAFERSVLTDTPGLAECRDEMLSLGAAAVHLAGSGPGLFSMAADRADAVALQTAFRQGGLRAYLAATRQAGITLA